MNSNQQKFMISVTMEGNVETTTIQDLPEELFEIIFGFLPGEDLNSCFNVCRIWRHILSSNRFWKKCCLYPKQYYKLASRQIAARDVSNEICEWRKYFLLQKDLLNNLKEGRLVSVETSVDMGCYDDNVDFVDDHGQHWLFKYEGARRGILNIWNITDEPYLHSRGQVKNCFKVVPIRGRILIRLYDSWEVFCFKHPDYKLRLKYRIELVKEQGALSTAHTSHRIVNYILVDDHFIIGYFEKIFDLHNTVIHVWNLDSGSKMATHNVYQQSFVEYVKSVTGRDITKNSSHDLFLALFPGDNGRFLVTWIDIRRNLKHISLFSLVEKKFIKEVARLECKCMWGMMKSDIAVICYVSYENSFQISVFDVNQGILAELTFTFETNGSPLQVESEACTTWNLLVLESNKVIFKVVNNINVLSLSKTIVGGIQVQKHVFEVDKKSGLLAYFAPNLLFLFNNEGADGSSVSIWDIDSKVKLRKLTFPNFSWPLLSWPRLNRYPYRILFRLKEDYKLLGIVKFDPDYIDA